MKVQVTPRRDATTLLLRALRAKARVAGLDMIVEDASAADWASITFIGTRHRIIAEFGGATDAASAWVAALPDAAWTIPGLLVADLSVTTTGGSRVTITALTLFEE